MRIIDQWKNDPNKPKVSKRYIINKGQRKDGTYNDPSNNADAFSIIEQDFHETHVYFYNESTDFFVLPNIDSAYGICVGYEYRVSFRDSN